MNTTPDEVAPSFAEAPAAGSPKPKHKKKDKVRSAWISFIGRILAQILGAVATITLGLALADHLRGGSGAPPGSATATPVMAAASAPASFHDPRVSVAVLPLELYGDDPAQQYLADALTEELIAELTKASALRVISRTSALHFRHNPKPVPEIAATLGATIVVEGCMLREDDKIVVRLRALHGAEDTALGTVIRMVPITDERHAAAALAPSMARELTELALSAFSREQ